MQYHELLCLIKSIKKHKRESTTISTVEVEKKQKLNKPILNNFFS